MIAHGFYRGYTSYDRLYNKKGNVCISLYSLVDKSLSFGTIYYTTELKPLDYYNAKDSVNYKNNAQLYLNFDAKSTDGSTVFINKNITYSNAHEELEEPSFYYNVYDTDTGYKVSVTPLNVQCPYTLKCYFDGDFNNFYTLQENSSTMTTSNFIVRKSVSKLMFVCDYEGGSLSLEVRLSGNTSATITRQPYLYVEYDKTLSRNDVSSLVNNPTADFYHQFSINYYNLKSGYKIYWNTVNNVFFEDKYLINYDTSKSGCIFYMPDTKDVVNKTVYFFICDEKNNVLYRYELNTTDNTYNSVFQGNGSGNLNNDNYNGSFGDLDNIDIGNFDVNNGINSIKSMFEGVKGVLEVISYMLFGFLPSWITTPLYTLLLFVIVITIIKLIRG